MADVEGEISAKEKKGKERAITNLHFSTLQTLTPDLPEPLSSYLSPSPGLVQEIAR